jgi:HEAT repeat protein
VAQGLPKVAAVKTDFAVAALTKVLGDGDLDLRVKAAIALGEFGPKAKASAGALGRALLDKEAAVAKACLDTLGKLGSEAGAAAPDIVALLKKSDQEKQVEILKLLAEVGPGARIVIPDVAAIGFNDTNNKVLFDATVAALEKMAKEEAGQKSLYGVARNPSASLRIGAIMSLEQAVSEAKDRDLLLNYLLNRLNNNQTPERDAQVRGVMADVIGRLRTKKA